MFDAFWNTLNGEDITELNYVTPVSYSTDEQRDEIIEKLDWMILKLHKLGRNGEDDLGIIKELKEQIKYNECSLNHNGIEYLNKIALSLKSVFGL